MSTAKLAEFLSAIEYRTLPEVAVDRTKGLFLDWVACSLAGHGSRPVVAMENFSRHMGPANGASEVLVSRTTTSPLFAAYINAAASHVVEQDDLHNTSIMHPATVVFPAALACAQEIGASGEQFLTACVAGYEAATRVGEFLGRSHYEIFHTTGTSGTLGAAAAVGRLLNLDAQQMNHALGSAGTQAAGLWEFLRDAADSKQLHTAKAAGDGLLAAYLASDGFTGATRVLEGKQGLGAGMSRQTDPGKLTANLGESWAVCHTSIKFHACCRHTHPAADALSALIAKHEICHRDIAHITARVYQSAYDVLSAVDVPQTVHQSKFSMGFVLALIAREGRAGVHDFDEAAVMDGELLDLASRVEMVVDPVIDVAHPMRWMATVDVDTVDGRKLSATMEEPKGDPGNPLSREELEAKAIRVGTFANAISETQMIALIQRLWMLESAPQVGRLLPSQSPA
jgi:2-methylcitrate dehydratase PrpD